MSDITYTALCLAYCKIEDTLFNLPDGRKLTAVTKESGSNPDFQTEDNLFDRLSDLHKRVKKLLNGGAPMIIQIGYGDNVKTMIWTVTD